MQADGTITALAPFYIGLTGGRNARVVTPRHHAVPRRGWVGAGRLLGAALCAHPLHRELLTLMRRFTATTYNGAFLLQSLKTLGFPTSPTAVATTIKNYHANLISYRQPPSLAAVATRSQYVVPFLRGQRVFAKLDGEWHEATVNMLHRDGTISITYLDPDLQADDPEAARKPEGDVRPDIVHPNPNPNPTGGPEGSSSSASAHPKDPEEDVDECRAMVAAYVAESGEADRAQSLTSHHTYLDVLGELGEYTALLEVIFGHEDHFGSKAGALVENKFLIPRGAPHPTWSLSEAAASSVVPWGALAVPRYKFCTMIGAMQDVELHELHGVYHGGRSGMRSVAVAAEGGSSSGKRAAEDEEPSGSQQAKKRRKQRAARATLQAATYTSPRACWFRNPDDSDGVCYPEGLGVADWLSKTY